jgi:hypothetical protein
MGYTKILQTQYLKVLCVIYHVRNTCLLITRTSHMQLHSKQNSMLKTIKNPTHRIDDKHLNKDSGPFIEFI